MRQYTMYVCETCGYESKDAKKMKEHEMAHMNLTAEEVRQSEKIYMKNKVYLIWLINDDGFHAQTSDRRSRSGSGNR